MKKRLFLLLVLLITCCFISCKKECVCRFEIEGVYDDELHQFLDILYEESIQLGQLSDIDCKNWVGHIDTVRYEDGNIGLTTYFTYAECFLQ
jgi:hypothetical protein